MAQPRERGQAERLQRAAEMQQHLDLVPSYGPCCLYFGEACEVMSTGLDGLQLGDRTADALAAYAAVMEEWLVARWGFVVSEMHLTFETAFRYLVYVLEFDMAYNTRRRAIEDAHHLALQFMDLFSCDDACFYGNMEWGTFGHGNCSWQPILLPGERRHLFEFVLVGLQPGFTAAFAFADDD